jgi:hypothetical protein
VDFSFEAKDQRWHLSPLTIGDMVKLKAWVQFYPWECLQKQRDRMDPETFNAQSSKLLLECAFKRVNEKSPEFAELLETPEGIAQLAFLMMKRNHPTLTVDDVQELLTTRNLEEVATLVVAVSNVGRKQPEDPFAETKKPKKKIST